MSDYINNNGGHYQAPYYRDSSGNYFEPAGDATKDGSNMTDYVSFCMDCHQYATPTTHAIKWRASDPAPGSPDKHGEGPSGTPGQPPSGDCGNPWTNKDVKAPYSNALKETGWNYVLSCLDCHEPHSGRNTSFLLRRFINGETVNADSPTCWEGSANGDWDQICDRCHTEPDHVGGGCSSCHGHGVPARCDTGIQPGF